MVVLVNFKKGYMMTKLFKSLALLSLIATSKVYASAELLMPGADAVAAPAIVFESEDLSGISYEMNALLLDIQTLIAPLSGNIADTLTTLQILSSFQYFVELFNEKIRGKSIEGLQAEEQIDVLTNIEHPPIGIHSPPDFLPITLFASMTQSSTFSRARFIAYKNKVRDIVGDVNTVEYSVEPVAGYVPTQTLASLVERFQSPDNIAKLNTLLDESDDDLETLLEYNQIFKATSLFCIENCFQLCYLLLEILIFTQLLQLPILL